MKVGVLYARSKEHPELTPDFLDGLKSSLKHGGQDTSISLLMESIGFGAVEKEVYEKAEKLLLIENADILVAYIDTRVLALLEPLIYSTGKLIIIINAGANYPEDKVPQPNVIFLSLRHSFLCWLTGKYAGSGKVQNAAVATSFYDAGYLHISAMVRSYNKQGGAIRFNYVYRGKYDESFSIDPLIDFLSKESDTRQVFSIFDSIPSPLFYEALNQLEISNELQLFVSPMMLEPSATQKKSFQFEIQGYAPYFFEEAGKPNEIFKSGFKEISKRNPSIFALQGWELGLVLKAIYEIAENSYEDGSGLREQLLSKKINSPRGELQLDEQTNYFIGPVYQVNRKKDQTENEYEKQDPNSEWAEFLLNPVQGVSSGWTNSYLCY